MRKMHEFEIVLVSSGHQATDHRVFDKEAVSLAKRFPRVRVVATHPIDETRDQVRITALPPCRSRLQRFLLRPLSCFYAARGTGSRLLILHDAELLLWAPLVKAITGWRIIYDVHEDFAQLILRRRWIPLPLRRSLSSLISFIEKLFSRSCDGVIGVTEVLTNYFSHHRRVAIYNLPSREFIVASAEQAQPIEAREYDIVHLGTLSEERLEYLCEILDGLFRQKPEARILIIGLRPDQLASMTLRYPTEQVAALGKVPYEEIAGHLGNCRIGLDIHPVLYPHLRCAVPVKVFEYMAAGCNVVTSYLPELHRLLGDEGAEHTATIMEPSTTRFTDEIVRLLDSPESLQRHQQVLMPLVSNQWNWEHEAEKLVQFITTITEGKEIVTREQVFDH
ncbi:MAG: glycosyltransferase [Armatimonadota bacterium]